MSKANLNIALVLSKGSRQAGGLFESVPGLARSLLGQPGVNVAAISVRDAYAGEDAKKWPCPIKFLPPATLVPKQFGYAPTMLATLLAEDPSLVFCHGLWSYHNLVVDQWARRTRRPYIVVPHGMLDVVDLQKSRIKKAVARRFYLEHLLQHAACVRAISQSEADSIRAYGVRAPICLIPNGIELPDKKETPPPAWKESLPSNAKVLLYIGRIHPKKGLPALLDAWAKIKDLGLWQLVIAGWDQDRHEAWLKSRAQELAISKSVHFVGPLFGAEKDAAFRHADGFVLPSTSEGLPNVILEAWGYHLPVVMTPECNIPEGFDAKAAIRVETNAESIAHGISQLCQLSDQGRRDMAGNGHRLVTQKFCWPEIGLTMLDVCKWALGLGSKPACVIDT